MDPPTFVTLPYTTYEPIEICGVKIPKDRSIQGSILALNYNSNEWQEPLKFLPERFDPENPYFLTPNGTQRNPLSLSIFSYGTRACPGQILAMLELKVLVTKLLLSIEYEVDPDQLNNDYARFAMFSNFKLKMKLVKKL